MDIQKTVDFPDATNEDTWAACLDRCVKKALLSAPDLGASFAIAGWTTRVVNCYVATVGALIDSRSSALGSLTSSSSHRTLLRESSGRMIG